MLSYLLFIATIGGIYGLLALSLNLIWGGVGMVNLGLAGFFAVGAYASALLTTVGHAPIATGWLMALVAGGFAGLVVTLSTTRLREDYLAIVTLGFAEAVRLVASNEIWLTRGTDGISGIPGPWKRALGHYFNAVYFLLVVVALKERNFKEGVRLVDYISQFQNVEPYIAELVRSNVGKEFISSREYRKWKETRGK